MTLPKEKFNVLKSLKKTGRFRVMPLVLASTLLSALPYLSGKIPYQLVGLQTFQVMFNVLILIILGIVTLGYMALVYEKEWFGGSYKNNNRKWFNIISFAFIGLVAAYTPYLLGVGNLFFGYVDHLNGGHNTLTLHLVNLFTFFVAFIPADMFRSLDGKSGILYRMPKRILIPLPNYNSLDYKLNKFFGLV